MRNTLSGIILFFAASYVFSLSSCSKSEDEGKPPYISFKTGAGYVSTDTVISKGDTITIGIKAALAEKNDILTKLTVVRTYDNTDTSTIVNYTIPAPEADSLSKDYTIKLRNTAGTEKYAFTVVNKDGILNSIKLTVTTN